MKNKYGLIVCFAFAFLAFAPNANADVVVFSNNFEDDNFDPEVGTWTHGATTTENIVAVSTAGSTNGSFIGLLDQTSPQVPLDLTINLTDTALLTGGNTVTIDFDIAARRTSTASKTIFLDALDSNGAIVTRLVLGDVNAFGNAGGDRQRVGYDIDSTGNANSENSVFNLATGTGATGTAIGSFWFGADTNPGNNYDVNSRDAQVSLTIGASTFGIDTQKAFAGPTYSTSGVTNYNGGTFADIAEIKLSTVGGNYGFWLDNIVVTATAIPEPGSLTLISVAALGLCGVRRRR